MMFQRFLDRAGTTTRNLLFEAPKTTEPDRWRYDDEHKKSGYQFLNEIEDAKTAADMEGPRERYAARMDALAQQIEDDAGKTPRQRELMADLRHQAAEHRNAASTSRWERLRVEPDKNLLDKGYRVEHGVDGSACYYKPIADNRTAATKNEWRKSAHQTPTLIVDRGDTIEIKDPRGLKDAVAMAKERWGDDLATTSLNRELLAEFADQGCTLGYFESDEQRELWHDVLRERGIEPIELAAEEPEQDVTDREPTGKPDRDVRTQERAAKPNVDTPAKNVEQPKPKAKTPDAPVRVVTSRPNPPPSPTPEHELDFDYGR